MATVSRPNSPTALTWSPPYKLPPLPSVKPRPASCPAGHWGEDTKRTRLPWWWVPTRMKMPGNPTPKAPARSDSPQSTSPQAPPSQRPSSLRIKIRDAVTPRPWSQSTSPQRTPSPTSVDAPTVDPKAIHPKKLKGAITRMLMWKRIDAPPEDLSPTHIGRHPIPWSMPDEEDLRIVFTPKLVKWIQESDYRIIAPGRCFCSLVLYELNKRLSDHIMQNGSIGRNDLQSQLGDVISDDALPLDHLLDTCADGYKMHKIRRILKRQLTHNT